MRKQWRKYGRKFPYTEEEIQRLPCFRCGTPAKYQWQICSDGNVYRPLCAECDIELNDMVLRFMGFTNAEHEKRMGAYRVRAKL